MRVQKACRSGSKEGVDRPTPQQASKDQARFSVKSKEVVMGAEMHCAIPFEGDSLPSFTESKRRAQDALFRLVQCSERRGCSILCHHETSDHRDIYLPDIPERQRIEAIFGDRSYWYWSHQQEHI